MTAMNSVNIRLVPKKARKRTCEGHGVDVIVDDAGRTTLRVCPCLQVTFPDSAEATGVVDSLDPAKRAGGG